MNITIESQRSVTVTQRKDPEGRTIVVIGSDAHAAATWQPPPRPAWPRWLLPAAVAAACWAMWSLPVIVFSKWFPLDYSALITLSDEWARNAVRFLSPYASETGRYFPFYWAVFGLQSYFYGTTAWLYSSTLSVVLLAAFGALSGIVYWTTPRTSAAIILLPLLYLGTPVAENVSTIGKSEPYLCLLIFSALAIFLYQCYAPAHRTAAMSRYALIGVAFAMAMWTKETSVALLGFCAAGLTLAITGWAYLKDDVWRNCARDYVALLQSLLCGLVAAKLPYLLFHAEHPSDDYTAYEITRQLVARNTSFYFTQQPDVVIFGLFSAVLIGLSGWLLVRHVKPDRKTAHAFLLFAAMTAMGWAYYVVLLIWKWPMPYYMLLPACVFRATAVYGAFQLGLLAQWRWPRRVLGATVVLTTLYGFAYAWYVIGSQVEYSRVYSTILEQARSRIPINGRLYLESYPFYSEQVGGTRMWLKALGRPDIPVLGIADYLDPAVPSTEICTLLHVTDAMLEANRQRIPGRGDHLVVFTGDKLASWMLRGVTPYYCQQSLLAGTQGDFDLELVAAQQFDQYAIYPHVWTGAPTAGRTSLGYKLYKVVSDKPRFLWFDRYPDGWVGSHASLAINSPTPKAALIRVSAPPFTLPNRVTITCDGKPPVDVALVDAHEVLVPIACECPGGTSTIRFSVERVVAPNTLKMNKDTRLLGIRATCELADQAADDTSDRPTPPQGK